MCEGSFLSQESYKKLILKTWIPRNLRCKYCVKITVGHIRYLSESLWNNCVIYDHWTCNIECTDFPVVYIIEIQCKMLRDKAWATHAHAEWGMVLFPLDSIGTFPIHPNHNTAEKRTRWGYVHLEQEDFHVLIGHSSTISKALLPISMLKSCYSTVIMATETSNRPYSHFWLLPLPVSLI